VKLEAHLLPAFGSAPLGSITPAAIDLWRGPLMGLSNRTKNKLLVVMHGMFRRAQHGSGRTLNPVAGMERHPQRSSGGIDVFSPGRPWRWCPPLPRGRTRRSPSAALTGLRRGELFALRVRLRQRHGRRRCRKGSRDQLGKDEIELFLDLA
jgi:hypothetical protein